MSSYATDILVAMGEKLRGIPGLPPVVRRLRPVFWKGDPKRLVVLCLVSDEIDWETFQGEAANGRRVINVKYTTTATILIQDNAMYATDPDELLSWREQMRQRLYYPTLAGAATVWNSEIALGNVYDYAGLDRSYDAIPMTLVWHSKEPVHGGDVP